MTVLTNKVELCLSTNDVIKPRLIDIPTGSKIELIKHTSSYHAYYEMHTYRLICSIEDSNVIISCSQYVGSKEPKVSKYCIKNKLERESNYLRAEIFKEDFPI